MIALIDGDIVAYRCAASCPEGTPEGIATWRTNELMEIILRETGAQEWAVFLTGDGNFRYKVFPEYKANRLRTPRPEHLAACKALLEAQWGAVVSEGCEADDLLGVEQVKANEQGIETIICSIDKDLLCIPGLHYNFVKKEQKHVSPMDALRHFYTQLLVGDAADGIKGAAGIGPVKAGKILASCSNEREFYDACRVHFSCDPELELNAQVLWIWRTPNGHWKAPEEGEEEK